MPALPDGLNRLGIPVRIGQSDDEIFFTKNDHRT